VNSPNPSAVRALLLMVLLLLLPAGPLLAQCADPDCLDDGFGPTIGVQPDDQTYMLDEGASLSVAFTATFFDRNGVQSPTIAVRLNGSDVHDWTWEPLLDGTHGRIRGTISLSQGGENTLVVEAKDGYGNAGSGSAVLRVQFTDPELPIVYEDAHHGEYRDTTLSQFQLAYTTPSYTSLDKPHAVTLQYNSEFASPNAYVQVDAKPDPRTAANVTAMSLQIVDAATGSIVAREYFWAKNPSGNKQRMALFWSMRSRATGAYSYTAVVRSHFANGTFKEKRVPVRVLIVNEAASRYGAGWTIAGLPQIYGAVGGVILHEGNGVLRWYASTPCTTVCTFVRPEGDFSEITFNRGTGVWTRTYNDGATLTFNDRGMMTAMTDSFGRTTSLTWQNAGSPAVPVLTAITDPMQKRLTFTYTAGGYLQRITDPAGREVTVTISAAGDLTALGGPYGLQVAYGTTHLPTSYTDERGTWDVNFYRGTFSSLTAPAVFAEGRSLRPVTKFLRAEWKTTLLSAEGTGLTNLGPAVDSGNAVEEIVDPRGHKTILAKNRYGQITSSTDLTGTITGYSFDRNGLPLLVVQADGHTRGYDWNERGQLLTRYVDGIPAYQASYTRPDKPDYEITGGTTRWYTWGTKGELLRSWFGAHSDSSVNGTAYEYDALYRTVRITGPKGERREWTYGDWGNVQTARTILEDGSANSVTYTYDTAGRQYTFTNSLGQRTITNHDFRDRLSLIVDADDRVTKLDYTGDLLTRVTDAAGKVYGYTYNALGWLESESFPDGTSRTYAYNADGLLQSKTDRRGLIVRFTHDTAHRTLTRTADNATTTWSYPNRDTVTVSNPEGSQTTSLNSALGSLDSIRITFPSLPGRLYELKNVLDPDNMLVSVGTDLNLYSNGARLQTSSVRYDAQPSGDGGTLVITDPRGGITTLMFDAAGNHVQTLFPNNVAQSHSFATDGRQLGTWFGSYTVNQSLGADFTYDVLGRLSGRSDAPGHVKWAYGYTTAGQLASYKQSASMPPVGCNPRVQTCNPTWSIVRSGAYTYDAAGNRTDASAVVTPNSNRYASFGGYALEYDQEGNLTRKSKSGFEQRLTWNALGQLTSVTTNGAVVSYGYDPLGRRVRRTADGYSRYFVYENDDLLMELGPDGEPTRSYTHLPGTDRPLSVRENFPGYQSVHYYVLEQPGHVRALLDQNGAVVGEYAYTPFGEAIPTAKGDGTSQPLRFMARELDSAARLYYVRARWYDPEMGRFVSEDPIGLKGGINTYAYLNNDPMNGRDPSGLFAEEGDICDKMPWMNMCQTSWSNPFPLDPLIVNVWTGLGGHVTNYDPPANPWDPGPMPRIRIEQSDCSNAPTGACAAGNRMWADLQMRQNAEMRAWRARVRQCRAEAWGPRWNPVDSLVKGVLAGGAGALAGSAIPGLGTVAGGVVGFFSGLVADVALDADDWQKHLDKVCGHPGYYD